MSLSTAKPLDISLLLVIDYYFYVPSQGEEKTSSDSRCEDSADGAEDAVVTSPRRNQVAVPSTTRSPRESDFNSKGALDTSSVAMSKETLPSIPIPVVKVSPRSSPYTTSVTKTQHSASTDEPDWAKRKKTSKVSPVVTPSVSMFAAEKLDARAEKTSAKRPRETLPASPEAVLNVSKNTFIGDNVGSSLREWKSSEVMTTQTFVSGSQPPSEQPSLRISTGSTQQHRRNVHSLPSNLGSSKTDYTKKTLPPTVPASIDIGKKHKLGTELTQTQTWITTQRLSPEIKISKTEMFKDTLDASPVAVMKLPGNSNTKEYLKETQSHITVESSTIETKEANLPTKQEFKDLPTRQGYQTKTVLSQTQAKVHATTEASKVQSRTEMSKACDTNETSTSQARTGISKHQTTSETATALSRIGISKAKDTTETSTAQTRTGISKQQATSETATALSRIGISKAKDTTETSTAQTRTGISKQQATSETATALSRIGISKAKDTTETSTAQTRTGISKQQATFETATAQSRIGMSGAKDTTETFTTKSRTGMSEARAPNETSTSQSRTDMSKAQITTETPKTQSKIDMPKAHISNETPKTQSKTDMPKAQISTDTPKTQSKTEMPKTHISTETPKTQYKSELSKARDTTSKAAVSSTPVAVMGLGNKTVGVDSSGISRVGVSKASTEKVQQGEKAGNTTGINKTPSDKFGPTNPNISKDKKDESHKINVSENVTSINTATDGSASSWPNPNPHGRDELETSVISRLESTGFRRDVLFFDGKHNDVREKPKENSSQTNQSRSVIKPTESDARSKTTDKEHVSKGTEKSATFLHTKLGQDSSTSVYRPLIRDDDVNGNSLNAGQAISSKKVSVHIAKQQISSVTRESEQNGNPHTNDSPAVTYSTNSDSDSSVLQDKLQEDNDQAGELQKESYKLVTEMNPNQEGVLSGTSIPSKTKTTVGSSVEHVYSDAKSFSRNTQRYVASSKENSLTSVSTIVDSGAKSEQFRGDRKEGRVAFRVNQTSDTSPDSSKGFTSPVKINDNSSSLKQNSSVGKGKTSGDVKTTGKYSDLLAGSSEQMQVSDTYESFGDETKPTEEHVDKVVKSKTGVSGENTNITFCNITAKQLLEKNVYSCTSSDSNSTTESVNPRIGRSEDRTIVETTTVSSNGDTDGIGETWHVEDLSYHSWQETTLFRNQSGNLPDTESASVKQPTIIKDEGVTFSKTFTSKPEQRPSSPYLLLLYRMFCHFLSRPEYPFFV
ncbi:dentin sialophosphoprotein-like isoform X2 [Gigantopelta aegis]|uniref:dentin sialophosphoprotein-like isoform X2 n=1 Tax=Gigantopelta aegis TaxID=1735272 RepID=UPI001B88B5AC|nr:dentin sialophosphoprotein-like isoform X2 [Gigantopelta aegis]